MFVTLNFLLVRGVNFATFSPEVDRLSSLISELPDDNVDKQNFNVLLFALAAYQRDIEAGKGERDLFYNVVFKLWQYNQNATELLLKEIFPTDHACWKDVLLMIEKLETAYTGIDWANNLSRFIFGLFLNALSADKAAMEAGKKPSLACKWAPRQQTHFDRAPLNLAKKFATNLFPEIKKIPDRMKVYRKFLSAATAAMGTVESLMCGGDWDKINPGAVPSKAMKIYRLALQNKTKTGSQRSEDPKRVALSQRLIQFLSSGKKIHGKTLMVHEVIAELIRGHDDVLEAQLKSIIEDFKAIFPPEIGLIFPLADVSGSMEQTIPGSKATLMHVSIALAFLLSQVDGPFKDKVMTFDSDPQIYDLSKSTSLTEKISIIRTMKWGGSTDFGKAMDYVLRSLKENGVAPENIPALNLVVFSDMQFNQAAGNGGFYGANNVWATAQERISAMYRKEGFPVPRVIYWNLNARSSAGMPSHAEEKNVVMLSGFSQSALKTFLKGDILPEIVDDPESSPQKNPWDVLAACLASYTWLMQAYEKSGLFPGYKAPVVEEAATAVSGSAAAAKSAKDDEWEKVD